MFYLLDFYFKHYVSFIFYFLLNISTVFGVCGVQEARGTQGVFWIWSCFTKIRWKLGNPARWLRSNLRTGQTQLSRDETRSHTMNLPENHAGLFTGYWVCTPVVLDKCVDANIRKDLIRAQMITQTVVKWFVQWACRCACVWGIKDRIGLNLGDRQIHASPHREVVIFNQIHSITQNLINEILFFATKMLCLTDHMVKGSSIFGSDLARTI